MCLIVWSNSNTNCGFSTDATGQVWRTGLTFYLCLLSISSRMWLRKGQIDQRHRTAGREWWSGSTQLLWPPPPSQCTDMLTICQIPIVQVYWFIFIFKWAGLKCAMYPKITLNPWFLQVCWGFLVLGITPRSYSYILSKNSTNWTTFSSPTLFKCFHNPISKVIHLGYTEMWPKFLPSNSGLVYGRN